MSRETTSRSIVTTGLFIALGLIVPYFMGHAFGVPGNVFLPMHIPIILCGLIVGPAYGAVCGILTPAISSLLTGMPPVFPMLPIMIVELAVYGFVSGYLYRKKRLPIYLSLVLSMIAGRVCYGLMFQGLVFISNNNLKASSVIGAVITGLPGIILQLILIPVLVKAVEKVRGNDFGKQEYKSNVGVLDQALKLIKDKKASCIVFNDTEVLLATEGKGVSPLINIYENQPELLKNTYVADKIIGKAAAVILLLGGVDFVYGELMSEAAKEYLEENKIRYEYGRCINMIKNRDETGICPIEKSVLETNDPEEAYQIIKNTIANTMKKSVS